MIDQLTKCLVGLYEVPEVPMDAMEFVTMYLKVLQRAHSNINNANSIDIKIDIDIDIDNKDMHKQDFNENNETQKLKRFEHLRSIISQPFTKLISSSTGQL